MRMLLCAGSQHPLTAPGLMGLTLLKGRWGCLFNKKGGPGAALMDQMWGLADQRPMLR